MAAGRDGTVLHSSDGQTWESVPSMTTRHFGAIAWSGSSFAVAGSHGMVVTSDAAFHAVDTATIASRELTTIAWTGARFVTCHMGVPSVMLGSCRSGTVGGGWENSGTPHFWHLTRIGNTLAGISRVPSDMPTQSYVRISSDSGVTWESHHVPMPSPLVPYRLAWTGERLILVGDGGGILVSD